MPTKNTPGPRLAPACCTFDLAWRGACAEPSIGATQRCIKHVSVSCTSCGGRASHECDRTGVQFVCGSPLCDDCTGAEVKGNGSDFFGFGGHVHVRKLGAPPIPEAPASASPEAGTPKETPMSLIDIKAVEQEAQATINKERADKAKGLLVKQMRAVEAAREVLRGEELKLADVKRQIEDGTF